MCEERFRPCSTEKTDSVCKNRDTALSSPEAEAELLKQSPHPGSGTYSESTPLPSVEGTLHPSPPRRRQSEPPRDTPSLRSARWPPSAAAPSPPGNTQTDVGLRRWIARASGRLSGKQRDIGEEEEEEKEGDGGRMQDVSLN